MSDFEDDPEGKLSITDPYGNEMDEQARACGVCGAVCAFSAVDGGNCYGAVTMMDDVHKCGFHGKHGSPEAWYVSEDTDTESPVQRELGTTAKRLSNHGGTFSDEPDSGSVDNGMIRKSDDDETTEDPHYTDGDIK